MSESGGGGTAGTSGAALSPLLKCCGAGRPGEAGPVMNVSISGAGCASGAERRALLPPALASSSALSRGGTVGSAPAAPGLGTALCRIHPLPGRSAKKASSASTAAAGGKGQGRQACIELQQADQPDLWWDTDAQEPAGKSHEAYRSLPRHSQRWRPEKMRRRTPQLRRMGPKEGEQRYHLPRLPRHPTGRGG